MPNQNQHPKRNPHLFERINTLTINILNSQGGGFNAST